MKQFIASKLLVIGALAFFVGCGDEVKSIDYYEKHPEEAKAKVKQCEKMGKMSDNQKQDCDNALQGDWNASWSNVGKSQKIIPGVSK